MCFKSFTFPKFLIQVSKFDKEAPVVKQIYSLAPFSQRNKSQMQIYMLQRNKRLKCIRPICKQLINLEIQNMITFLKATLLEECIHVLCVVPPLASEQV